MRPDDCKAWACRRLIRLNRKRRADALRGAAGQPPLGAAPRPPGSALAHVMFDAPGALTGLGQELREALVLVVIGGFAYAQAASILGIPETTLGSRIAEARRRLDEIMRATAQPGARRAPHLRLVK